MPGKYIRCWSCGWSQLRFNAGKPVTVCGCGQQFNGISPPTSQPKHVGPSAKRWVNHRKATGAKPQALGGQSPSIASPAETSNSDMDLSNSDTREFHVGIIAKYEPIIAGLDPVTDSAVISSLTAKVNASKQAIIALRPLSSQITSLEAWLDRKSSQLLEYQRTIVDTHNAFLLLKQDVSAKRLELSKLKQALATEVAGQPVQPLDLAGQLRNASLEHQLAGLHAVVSQVATAIASMDNAPPGIRSVLEPFLAPSSKSEAGSIPVAPATFGGPPAPASPPHSLSPGQTHVDELFAASTPSDYGPAQDPLAARHSPFSAAEPEGLEKQAMEAAAAHTTAVATSSSTAPESFSHSAAPEKPPG